MTKLPVYIEILKAELETRQKKNPRFSLRGFAAMLDIHPSALSRILSGKQQMSLAICRQVLEVLSLDGDSHSAFVHSYADTKRQQILTALNAGIFAPNVAPQIASPLAIETYENLVEIASGPAWFASLDGATFFGNRFLKQFVQLDESEQIADASFIHTDDQHVYQQALERTKTAALASECDLRLRSGSGDFQPFKIRIAPIRDYARNLTSWLVTAAAAESTARSEVKSHF